MRGREDKTKGTASLTFPSPVHLDKLEQWVIHMKEGKG